jgi:NAD(P)-dependent dehydrogenase (short-subunit alcohol dehydrogenase family)
MSHAVYLMLDHALEDRNAVATGCSGGIRLAIAQGLQEAGAAAVILSRNKEKQDQAAASLRNHDPQPQAFRVDVTNWAQFQEPSLRIEQEFVSVDILVNSQGITGIPSAAQVTNAGFRHETNQRLHRVRPVRLRQGSIIDVNLLARIAPPLNARPGAHGRKHA